MTDVIMVQRTSDPFEKLAKSCGLVLIAFALQKAIMVSIFGFEAVKLDYKLDPVLNIPKLYVGSAVTIFELLVGIIVLLNLWGRYLSAVLLLLNALGLVTYRILFTLSGDSEACPCVAYTGDISILQKYYINNSLTTITYVLLITGAALTYRRIMVYNTEVADEE